MVMWIAFILFIASILVIGYISSRKVSSLEDYMVGGRKLGPVAIICTQIATWVGAGSLVGYIGTGYGYGVVTIGYTAAAGIAALLIGMLWASWLRKKGFVTMPDWMGYIYKEDKYIRVFTSMWYVFMYCSWVVGQATVCGVMTAYLLGIPNSLGVLICGFTFIVFTVSGGLYTVAWTDVLLQILLSIGVIALIAGLGIAAFSPDFPTLQPLSAEYFNFSLPSYWWVISIMMSYFFGNLFGQTFYQRIYAARDLKTARKGLYGSLIALLVIGIFSSFIGLMIRSMGAELSNPDDAIFWLVEELFPPWIIAIYLIAILAAAFSTANSALNSAATNFANDIYHKVINEKASEQQILKVGKYATLLLGVLCVILALNPVELIIEIFKGGYVATMGGIFWPIILGMYWKGATKEAAKVTILLGGLTGIIFEFVPGLNALFGGGAIPGIVTGFLLMVTISLFTKTKCGGVAYKS